MPRTSSLFSAAFLVPKMVSASSTIKVGGSSSVIDRTTAAVLALTVISGWWQTASATSINRDLPQRFSGDVGVSRGACSHAGWACVAAHHSTTESWASADGNTTYLPKLECSWRRICCPSIFVRGGTYGE